MLLSRVLEEKLASLYRAGMIKGGVLLAEQIAAVQGRPHDKKADAALRPSATFNQILDTI